MLSPHKKFSALAQLIQLYNYVEAQPTTTPCVDCQFFKLANGMCMKWAAVIPAEDRPNGCDQFLFNQESMPF